MLHIALHFDLCGFPGTDSWGSSFFTPHFWASLIPAAGIRRRLILAALLLLLLLVFAYPATRFGFWQVMSSIIPHILVIFLALVFRRFSDSSKT